MAPDVTKMSVALGARQSAKAKEKSKDGIKEEYLCEGCVLVHYFGEFPRTSGEHGSIFCNVETLESRERRSQYLSCPDCNAMQIEAVAFCGGSECKLADGNSGQARHRFTARLGVSMSRGG